MIGGVGACATGDVTSERVIYNVFEARFGRKGQALRSPSGKLVYISWGYVAHLKGSSKLSNRKVKSRQTNKPIKV